MGEQTFDRTRKILSILFMILALSMVVAVVVADDRCKYGPDTCKPGYVWREANPNDHVCVTAEVRERTRIDNSLATQRRNPAGGAYGPNTCYYGYVWREAFPGDFVCVTGQTRAQAAQDNSLASSRKWCPSNMGSSNIDCTEYIRGFSYGHRKGYEYGKGLTDCGGLLRFTQTYSAPCSSTHYAGFDTGYSKGYEAGYSDGISANNLKC